MGVAFTQGFKYFCEEKESGNRREVRGERRENASA
jgi:hypothetical protein